MSELDVKLAGKSLADFTNTQLRLALGAVLYTNTADMWRRYLNQLGYSGDVSQMLQKYYVEYSVPQNFRNYINAGAFVYSPQQLFSDGAKGVVYDNNDFVDSATWRRNLLTYSEQFDNAAWVKTNVTVTANASSAPNGTTTADKIIATAVSGIHIVQQPFSNFVASTNYIVSAYVKAAEYSKFGIRENAITGAYATFDVSGSGSIIASGSGGTGSITSIGDGWFRVSMSSAAGGVNFNMTLFALDNSYSSGSPSAYSYTGNGTSGILVWGAQLELGASATTYQRITNFNSDFLAAFPSTTLFLDSAGTTPATVNGLVGLQLDKSANLALGAELVTNGDFSDGSTGWFVRPLWAVSGGSATATGASDSFQQVATPYAAGKWYRVEFDWTHTGGTLFVRLGTGPATTFTTSGRKVVYLLAVNTAGIEFYGGAASGILDNISVKEIQGNHRYQTTTGSKPVLRGTPVGSNIVTNGDFATDTVWTKDAGWTISSGTASKAAGSAANIAQSLALDAGRIVRVSYTIASISGGAVFIRLIGGAVVDGASRTTAGTFVEYLTVPASMTSFAIRGASTTVATIDNIEVVDVSAGQVTAPYGLQYDGVDDFMQTASVNFTATDKMFVCAGVRKLSDAAQGIVVELSGDTGSNNGSFRFTFPGGAGANTYAWLCKGTVASSVTASGYIAPITNVVSGIADIAGDSCLLRVNGVQVNQSTSDQGTGNFGNYALYFGRRAGAAVPYNGLDFGFVICGKTLTSTQIANTERWMSYRTGVTL